MCTRDQGMPVTAWEEIQWDATKVITNGRILGSFVKQSHKRLQQMDTNILTIISASSAR
jgi:hypothetical protein